MPWYAAQLANGPVIEVEAHSPAGACAVLETVKRGLTETVLRLDPMVACSDGQRLIAPPSVAMAVAEGRVRLR